MLLVQPALHVDAVSDAVAVGQNQRRPTVCLGFAEGQQGLLRVGAQGDARDIDIAVGNGLQRNVLLVDLFARRRKLGDGAHRRGFRHLAAGVGIHLGIHHQDIYVATAGQHMIDAGGTDVVGPAVAADDPDLRRTSWSTTASNCLARGSAISCKRCFSSRRRRAALAANIDFGGLLGVDQIVHQIFTDRSSQRLEQFGGVFQMLVGGQAETQTKFGVVLEQRVDQAGPRPSLLTDHGVVGRLPP